MRSSSRRLQCLMQFGWDGNSTIPQRVTLGRRGSSLRSTGSGYYGEKVKLVNKALEQGYRIVKMIPILMTPIPPAADWPAVRAYVLLLEADFTFGFQTIPEHYKLAIAMKQLSFFDNFVPSYIGLNTHSPLAEGQDLGIDWTPEVLEEWRQAVQQRLINWQKNNPEKVKAIKAKHREAHKDEISEYNRDYHAKNRASIRERQKQHYNDNREKLRDYSREWRANNPDKMEASKQESSVKRKAKYANDEEYKERQKEKSRAYYQKKQGGHFGQRQGEEAGCEGGEEASPRLFDRDHILCISEF